MAFSTASQKDFITGHVKIYMCMICFTQVFTLQGVVQHFRKYAYSLFCSNFNEKVSTALISGDHVLSYKWDAICLVQHKD